MKRNNGEEEDCPKRREEGNDTHFNRKGIPRIEREKTTNQDTMTTESLKELKNRVALLRDEALLRMVENKSGEYTAEALTIVNEEILRRGGLDALKDSIQRSETSPASQDDISRLKKFFLVVVVAACGLSIFALNGSFWFYWVCLFGLIAGLFAVLFRPKYNPEDEIKELLDKAAANTESAKSEGDAPT